ncbi:hypothetical protein D3C76_1111280 [compost metagenome]
MRRLVQPLDLCNFFQGALLSASTVDEAVSKALGTCFIAEISRSSQAMQRLLGVCIRRISPAIVVIAKHQHCAYRSAVGCRPQKLDRPPTILLDAIPFGQKFCQDNLGALLVCSDQRLQQTHSIFVASSYEVTKLDGNIACFVVISLSCKLILDSLPQMVRQYAKAPFAQFQIPLGHAREEHRFGAPSIRFTAASFPQCQSHTALSRPSGSCGCRFWFQQPHRSAGYDSASQFEVRWSLCGFMHRLTSRRLQGTFSVAVASAEAV